MAMQIRQRIVVRRPRSVRAAGMAASRRAPAPEAVSSRIMTAFGRAPEAGAPADVIRSMIRVIVSGGGDVRQPAKGAVLGLLRGTEVTGGATLEAIRYAAESVIRTTAEAAGDIAKAARGIVEGSIQGARELDLDVCEAASTAAHAALKAARELGSEAGLRVLHALTGDIAGVQLVQNGSYETN